MIFLTLCVVGILPMNNVRTLSKALYSMFPGDCVAIMQPTPYFLACLRSSMSIFLLGGLLGCGGINSDTNSPLLRTCLERGRRVLGYLFYASFANQLIYRRHSFRFPIFLYSPTNGARS